MKTAILFVVFTAVCFPAAALAESGCPKGQETCSASSKSSSDFLKAVEDIRKATSAAIVKAPERADLRDAKGQKTVSPNPTTTPVPDYSASAEIQESAAPAPKGLSRPAWLLLVGGGLAALYYYLKDGKRRGNKK